MKRLAAWLLLQPNLVIFLLSGNLYKTCMVGLMSRASYWAMADDIAEVTKIEAESIVVSMMLLAIS